MTLNQLNYPSLLLALAILFDFDQIFEQLVETVSKYSLNTVSTLESSHITLSQNTKGRWYFISFYVFFFFSRIPVSNAS